mgnify:CR=1 FL=1
MKAIHNCSASLVISSKVVLYLKDTEKWKQFTTDKAFYNISSLLCCISKIQKNESNSQLQLVPTLVMACCVVSQRYRKMKAIHNNYWNIDDTFNVVLYLKDTEKWKQFTTTETEADLTTLLCCISKIQKNESNSQLTN